MTLFSFLPARFWSRPTIASGWQPRDTVTAVLSVGGIVISIVTLYLTILRPPDLKVFLGDFLILRLTWDETILIAPEVAIYNSGAKAGAVFKIVGLFSSKDSDRDVRLTWRAVWKAKNIAAPGEKIKLFWDFASFPEIIVVPKTLRGWSPKSLQRKRTWDRILRSLTI
jgi:hypothetical protein